MFDCDGSTVADFLTSERGFDAKVACATPFLALSFQTICDLEFYKSACGCSARA